MRTGWCFAIKQWGAVTERNARFIFPINFSNPNYKLNISPIGTWSNDFYNWRITSITQNSLTIDISGDIETPSSIHIYAAGW